MRIELIQAFINATDAVLAEMLEGAAQVNDVVIVEEVYRRKGIAASVVFRGDIEGCVIFDLEKETALRVATALAKEEPSLTEQAARDMVCELANIVVGNAVTLLNDWGHSFKVFPPELHTAENVYTGGSDKEALLICFDTPCGKVHLNIALDYNRRCALVMGNPLHSPAQ